MADTPTTPNWEDIIAMLGENQAGGEENAMAMLDKQLGYLSDKDAKARQYRTEMTEKGVAELRPFQQGGQYWGELAKRKILEGAPKYTAPEQFQYADYKGQDPFQYEQFKFDSKYTPTTWDEFAKTRLGPENIKKSPFYDLYNWENEQQQKGIDKGLRARGMFGSGKGMTDALKAEVGLGERFAADEYGRGLQNYQMTEEQKIAKDLSDYNRALQGHTMGYGESKDKYAMTEDQLRNAYGTNQALALKKYGLNVIDPSNNKFMADTNSYNNDIATKLGLFNLSWLGSQGINNAYQGLGTNLGNDQMAVGQMGTSAMNSTGANLAGMTNAYGNQLGSAFGNTLNYGLGLQGLNQGQNNYDTANAANLGLGLGTLGVKAGQSILDYYGKPVASATPSSSIYYGDSNVPSNFWGGTGMPGDTGTGYGDTYTSWD